MGKFIDLKDQQINDWKVLEYVGNGKWKCQCKCGNIGIVRSSDLRNGTSRHCKDCRVIDLTGKTINEWYVIKRLENNKWLCRCSCGAIKEVFGHSLRNKTTINCGHNKQAANFIDLSGQTINEWKVGKYLGHSMYECTCSCGVVRNVHSERLRNGLSKSCGHSLKDTGKLSGTSIGEWKVGKYLGNSKYLCECSCGKITEVYRSNLQRSGSSSCGHDSAKRLIDFVMNRFLSDKNDEQAQILCDSDKFAEYIKSKNKPRIREIALELNCNENYIRERIHKEHLDEYVDIGFNTRSSAETELCDYLKSIYDGRIILNTRQVIPPYEIDIYLPDIKIGIEFNGTFWHSDSIKEKTYHQNKNVLAAKHKIQIIHIFEHEWINKNQKIKWYLHDKISKTTRIFARNTEVSTIPFSDANDFCEKYHLQGGTKASINIGLKYNGEIVSVMMLSKPRFDTEYDYEVARACSKPGITVVGGVGKLINYFIKTYKPKSIMTYVDISKFMAGSYLAVGFTMCKPGVTVPGYVWVNNDNKVIPRYKTQKKKLIELGLGTVEQTEDEIMRSLGYNKIYDCGNFKLEMIKIGTE